MLMFLTGEERHMPTAVPVCAAPDVEKWGNGRARAGRLGRLVRPEEPAEE